jgi:hypothetical protein
VENRKISKLFNNTNLFFYKNQVNKLSTNEKCSETELCNDLAGLSCQEGVCKCAKDAYWKENKCGNIFLDKLNFC